jgi:energy-coupling factor transport system ATP-binding protein
VALLISGVSYTYAGATQPSLRSVELSVDRGRVTGVVGANGAGKSTLCLVAVGLAPSVIGGTLDGVVEIDGLATASAPMHELAQRAAIVFQQPDTQISNAAPTVWEEVAFGPRNLGLPLAAVVERTWSALDALDIIDLAARAPGRLSGGQAQLVALAGVLALEPAYLVLDEPTSQLDPMGTELVANALRRAARTTGAGILVAEHKTDLLAGLCDHIVVLDRGAVVRHGAAGYVLADDRLADIGVAPPSAVALRRAAESAGLRWDDSWA